MDENHYTVDTILATLSLEEKIGQLTQLNLGDLDLTNETIAEQILDDRLMGKSVGVICISPRDSLETSRGKIQAVQQYLQRTTHGIQAFAAAETLHGLLAPEATIFPQAIALGSTWNPSLVKSIGVAIASEASAIGITQALAPVLDLGRDARFGRIEECYGECPTLVKHLGLAYIQGMQGYDVSEGLPSGKVLCTAKHFGGYSTPANGLNNSPVSCGPRDLRSLHFIPFKTAVEEAHLKIVMPCYNEVDGVPSHANKWLLTNVLREEWGFDGYVYSDWGGVSMNKEVHHIAEDFRAAAKLSLEAGVDLDAPGAHSYQHLLQMVQNGMVPESLVDQAVRRVLHVKQIAGLLCEARAASDRLTIHNDANVQLAREAAEESVILLQNQNSLLPLCEDDVKSIAVIGPNADQVQFGDYCWTKKNQHGVSILQGIQRLVGDKLKLNYAKGCNLIDLSTDNIPEAVATAEKSDVAIVVIGDTSSVNGGVGWEDTTVPAKGTVGETFDVSDPVPPGVQLDLVKAIHATGTPTIVIMLNGRPYSVPWIKKHIPTVILAFYPGERQGEAIADILFGRVNPSGRLPVSIAQTAGHIPTVYDYKPSGRGSYGKPGSPEEPGRDYVFSSPDPLWSFGHGCSYTTFQYRRLDLKTPTVHADGVMQFSVEVMNTGSMAGKEVVQVYINDLVSSATTPTKRLVAFEKVSIDAGSTA
jgi:beta-glucosidase